MGLLDKIKGMLGGGADRAKAGIGMVGDMVDERTGGEFADKIGMAEEKIGDVIDSQAEDDA